MIGTWTDKYPDERFPNTVDWTAVLDGAQIATCEAEVLSGGVVINDPEATSVEGAVQTVWVSGGQRGPVRVQCSITTDDSRRLEIIARFAVL